MGKASIKIAHFIIGVLAGILTGYTFFYFRPNSSQWEAVGAALIVTFMAILLLPKLYRGGGGGGDF